MLSSKEVSLVKSTVPLLEAGGPAITEYFYQRLFIHHPQLKPMFAEVNLKSGKQNVALFEAILTYATHIDRLDILSKAIDKINHRHVNSNVKPQHYEIIGEQFIATLKELYPQQFTTDIEQAWLKAYQQLADMFISQELQLYKRTH